jgi:ankyrin repeat protein
VTTNTQHIIQILEQEHDRTNLLQMCILDRQHDLLYALLAFGVNPNLTSSLGVSAMTCAADSEDLIAIDMLVRFGGSVRGTPTDESDPIDLAIIKDNLPLVHFLCKRGSTPWLPARDNETSREQRPPLDSAKSESMRALIKLYANR